jgi:hypothetical protein
MAMPKELTIVDKSASRSVLEFFSHFPRKWRMHDDLTCSAHVAKMTRNI